MARSIHMLLRYSVAVVVAFVTSLCVLFALSAGTMALLALFRSIGGVAYGGGKAPLDSWLWPATALAGAAWLSLLFVLVAFSGVFAGSLTLPRRNRVRSSMVLGIFGLLFAACVTLVAYAVLLGYTFNSVSWTNFLPALWLLAMLAMGAAVASIMIRGRWSGEGEDPANIVHSIFGRPEEAKRDPY